MSEGVAEVVEAAVAVVPRPETRAESSALQAFGDAQQYGLAALSGEQFAALVARMKLHDDRMRQVKEAMMTYGVHYGMPGKKAGELKEGEKVGIYKPGVELLLSLYGLAADVKVEVCYGDPENATSPAITVNARATIHRGSLDGPIVAVGVASRSSWETKYRWRNAGRACPECGKPALMLSKYPAKGGPFKGEKPWWCNTKRDGCGAEFAPGDERITSQQAAKVPNPDAHDSLLTLVKMAAKSARADGAITATRSSNLWTQDLEDLAGHAGPEEADVEASVGSMYDRAAEPRRRASKASAAHDAAGPMTEAQRGVIEKLMQERRGIAPADIPNVLESWPNLSVAEAGLLISNLQRNEGR